MKLLLILAYKGYYEELGVIPDHREIKLLGVAAEKAAAYTCWGFVARVNLNEKQIRKAWKSSKDYNEASALFVVPVEELSSWIQDQIPPDVWRKYDRDQRIDSNATLSPHPTVFWRAEVLNSFLGQNPTN